MCLQYKTKSSTLEYTVLAKGPLHLVVHVPPSRQVLGLHGLLEVPAPRPDELLQLHEVAVLAPTEDGFGHLLSVGIGLLAVAQPYWLELFLRRKLITSKRVGILLKT